MPRPIERVLATVKITDEKILKICKSQEDHHSLFDSYRKERYWIIVDRRYYPLSWLLSRLIKDKKALFIESYSFISLSYLRKLFSKTSFKIVDAKKERIPANGRTIIPNKKRINKSKKKYTYNLRKKHTNIHKKKPVKVREEECCKIFITNNEIYYNDYEDFTDVVNQAQQYQPVKVIFQDCAGKQIGLTIERGDRVNNDSLPGLIFHLYNEQIINLPARDRLRIPIGLKKLNNGLVTGIFTDLSDYTDIYPDTKPYTDRSGDGRNFYICNGNFFSTVLFAQFCLKHFGLENERFILVYRYKGERTPSDFRSVHIHLTEEEKNYLLPLFKELSDFPDTFDLSNSRNESNKVIEPVKQPSTKETPVLTLENLIKNVIQRKNEHRYLMIISNKGLKTTEKCSISKTLSNYNKYQPESVYFKDEDKVVHQWTLASTSQANETTLPVAAFTKYYNRIKQLPRKMRESFPIGQVNPWAEEITGIYTSKDKLKQKYSPKKILSFKYSPKESINFYIVYSHLFSTLDFIQTCLKRFGKDQEAFILEYSLKPVK